MGAKRKEAPQPGGLTGQVEKALELWQKLTFKKQGVEDERGVTSFSMRWGHLHDAHEDLKDAADLDPSGLLTMLLLDYYLEEYLSEWTLPVICLLGPEFVSPHLKAQLQEVEEDVALAKELFGLLRSPDLNAHRDDFRAGMFRTLEDWGIDREDVFDLLDDKHAMAFLRRDALNGAKRLSTHQFMQGDSDGAEPIFYREVARYWNVNSMIRSLTHPSAPSGVVLAILWEPDAEESYFAFGVKNGATISLVTDKTENAHPLQNSMSRSRSKGRRFDERASQYWFPYQVLGIKVNESGDMTHDKTHRTGLVRYQERPEPLVRVADLQPEQIVWLIMVFGLLKHKFWVEGYRTKRLSYTGEMVRVPEALGAGKALMDLSRYKPLELPPITVEEITDHDLALKRGKWRRAASGETFWLVDRYKDRVTADDLNKVGPDEQGILSLPASVEKAVALVKAKRSHFITDAERNIVHVGFESLDAKKFGTVEDIEADRYWVARYNLAKRIQQAAWAEFVERRAEIAEWYEERIKANAPALLRAVACGEFLAPDLKHDGGFGHVIESQNICGLYQTVWVPGTWRESGKHETRYVTGAHVSKAWLSGDSGDVGLCTLKWDHSIASTTKKRACFVTGTGKEAPFQAYFKPTTAAALALLCGCEVSDLPDVLQHWTAGNVAYRGNPILQRLDPMDWAIEDPWQAKMTFRVCIWLGPSGYNKIRKDAGLPPNRFWEEAKTDG
jgi:hypothetical protein